jgi:3-phosphoglycerate kinase
MNLNNFNITKAKIKKGNVVILRADFNVDIAGNKIVDSFRIDQTIPTINYLVKKGAKVLILAHLGDEGKDSLKPVHNYLNKKIKNTFVTDFDFNKLTQIVADQKPGSVILLENIRKLPGEKLNDQKLAKDFASLADTYINDAFSVSHRDHMSLIALPKYLPSYVGLSFENEIKHLNIALNPRHPMLFLLGGFKFGTKLPVLKKFTKIADKYFIGGALANNYILAEGYNVGHSMIDIDYPISKKALNDKNLIPIIDVVVYRNGAQKICALIDVETTDVISDIGPATVDLIKVYIEEAKTILWNGPMGWYEKGFIKSSSEILKLLADRVKSKKATVIIGGGDTALLVHKMKMQNSFTFVSTAGGATLDYLAHGTLPAIKAILKSKK